MYIIYIYIYDYLFICAHARRYIYMHIYIYSYFFSADATWDLCQKNGDLVLFFCEHPSHKLINYSPRLMPIGP